MTKSRTIKRPVRTVQTRRPARGKIGKVPAQTATRRKVVDRMYHQLFRGLSFAYALVWACREWAVFVNKDNRDSLKAQAASMMFINYFSPSSRGCHFNRQVMRALSRS